MVENALGHELNLGDIVTKISDAYVDKVDVGYIYQMDQKDVAVQWVAEADRDGVEIFLKDLIPEKISPSMLVKPSLPLNDKIAEALKESMFGN